MYIMVISDHPGLRKTTNLFEVVEAELDVDCKEEGQIHQGQGQGEARDGDGVPQHCGGHNFRFRNIFQLAHGTRLI